MQFWYERNHLNIPMLLTHNIVEYFVPIKLCLSTLFSTNLSTSQSEKWIHITHESKLTQRKPNVLGCIDKGGLEMTTHYWPLVNYLAFFLCIRQSKVWPHVGSGIMAKPRSIMA